ncbi:MAG: tetratricopeptide repeat protein [Chitinophagaceae bacterium]|jgi:tetratricopeptide (TPR) repeat protein|nr:tetratricopeptide repeat protein [Chitinophagaceae bacterium]
MKKRLFSFCLLFISTGLLAQEPDAAQLHETAKQFMRGGDWTNAVLVLNKALAKEPGSIAIQKDLALTYYYQRDFAKAREVIKPLLDRDDADVQVYQIAGNIYKALQESKDAEKMYRKAIKKYPNSGALYAEFGELLWMMNENFACIEQWEQGIKTDPGYAGNYYYASRYYFFTTDKVWALLYGEMFINMESYSSKTAEIKNLLLDSYKKFFVVDPKAKPSKNKNEFTDAFMTVMNQNSSVISNGITTESLIMLRTRFLLDWNKLYAAKFPFRLFDHHKQLLQEGMFDAYNQWIFEAAGDLAKYESWTKLNAEQYSEFTRFQKSKLFKVPAGQYYKAAN